LHGLVNILKHTTTAATQHHFLVLEHVLLSSFKNKQNKLSKKHLFYKQAHISTCNFTHTDVSHVEDLQ